MSDQRILWFDTDDMEVKFKAGVSQKLGCLLTDCTAVVCYNDQIALKIIEAARAGGIDIPKDISLVSFDDSPLAVASSVKLTTVAHPKELLGEQAAGAIIEMIERRKNHFDMKILPKLIVRDSTKSIK